MSTGAEPAFATANDGGPLRPEAQPQPPPASAAFPFNRLDYAAAHGGRVELPSGSPAPVLVAPIAGSHHLDGRLPLPYVDLDGEQVDALRELHADLVTLTGVLRPAVQAPLASRPGCTLVPLKPHYLFDPQLGLPALSCKTRSNLRRGQRHWRPERAGSAADWLRFDTLYRAMLARRHLRSGLFDYPADHFQRLSALPFIRLFGVRDDREWGSMACGAEYCGELHLLHVLTSPSGLASNASYVLMQHLLEHALSRDETLFIGGVAGSDDGGMLRFKLRWSNTQRMSWLLKMVIRPQDYRRLAIAGNPYFPAYRHPT